MWLTLSIWDKLWFKCKLIDGFSTTLSPKSIRSFKFYFIQSIWSDHWSQTGQTLTDRSAQCCLSDEKQTDLFSVFLSAVTWLVKGKVLVRYSGVQLARGHGRSTECLYYNIQTKAGRVCMRIQHQAQFKIKEQWGESSLRGRYQYTGSSCRYQLYFPPQSPTLTVTELI